MGGLVSGMAPRGHKSEDIKKALTEAIDSVTGETTEEKIERILLTLDSKKVLRYHRDSDVALLSTPGRVLVSIIEDPTMTIRAISVYLDLSETMIDKTVKSLIAAGLITKTKVNRQNIYKVNKNMVLKQPDIHHFLSAINKLNGSSSDDVENEDVF